MTATLTVLDGPTVRNLRALIFRQRELTLSEAAAPYTPADWQATTLALRAQTRAALVGLPAHAYEPRPAVDGNEVWSAGQIVGHLVMAQLDIFGKRVRHIVGAPPTASARELTGLPDDAHLSPAEALHTLDIADQQLANFFAAIPPDADLTREGADEDFGQASAGGLLLVLAIHEEDHCGQLNQLQN